MDRMTPPEEHYRYREQIGAFLLGKLDEGERTALQRHLSSCPACRAEERELEPVVAALSYAAPDRIDESRRPPEDLEESTLAPILGEMHRARHRRRRLGWSALAAAAICVVVIGLAGFTRLLEPAVALEPLSISGQASGVKVKGNLITHARDTEIRFVVSRSRDGQTHRVTLVSEGGERVNSGTFIGIGDEPLRCTFDAALSREDAARLEVRTTPGGELVFFAELPEEPRVAHRDWSLFGTLPWADLGPENGTTEANGSACREATSPGDPPPLDMPEKPKANGSGGGTPHKGSSPESSDKWSSSGGDKPGATSPGTASPGTASPGTASPGAASPETASPRAAPEESDPGRGAYERPPSYRPPPVQPPADDQYEARQ
jgi:Putative zinc-finger